MFKPANTAIVISARLLSSRLPFKALLPIDGDPSLKFLIDRLLGLNSFGYKIILATTDQPSDDQLVETVQQTGISIFRGSCENLINRYSDVIKQYNLSNVVRITGDCPLLNIETVLYCLDQIGSEEFDLFTTREAFPKGMDLEVFTADALERLLGNFVLTSDDCEHLTKRFYEEREHFLVKYFKSPSAWNKNSGPFTLDTADDYLFIQRVVREYTITTSETGPFYAH